MATFFEKKGYWGYDESTCQQVGHLICVMPIPVLYVFTFVAEQLHCEWKSQPPRFCDEFVKRRPVFKILSLPHSAENLPVNEFFEIG